MEALISELRELIVEAAPDPAQAAPVQSCGKDDRLDDVIPFSSLIVLGTVVAIEEHFNVRVTRAVMARAFEGGGMTLTKLATMVEELRSPEKPSSAESCT